MEAHNYILCTRKYPIHQDASVHRAPRPICPKKARRLGYKACPYCNGNVNYESCEKDKRRVWRCSRCRKRFDSNFVPNPFCENDASLKIFYEQASINKIKESISNESLASFGNDNFENFESPTNHHTSLPCHISPVGQCFQLSGNQRHFNIMHEEEEEEEEEEDDDDIDVVNQLLQLSDDQLNQLLSHKAAKIRDLQTKLSQR